MHVAQKSILSMLSDIEARTLANIREKMIKLENNNQTDSDLYEKLSDDFLTIATNIVESALFEDEEE